MKITDVNAYVVVPECGRQKDDDPLGISEWQWTFVTIDTDEGLQG